MCIHLFRNLNQLFTSVFPTYTDTQCHIICREMRKQHPPGTVARGGRFHQNMHRVV